jgi:hypothetical protein
MTIGATGEDMATIATTITARSAGAAGLLARRVARDRVPEKGRGRATMTTRAVTARTTAGLLPATAADASNSRVSRAAEPGSGGASFFQRPACGRLAIAARHRT